MNICIFGASSRRLDQIFYQESEKTGRLIAEAGHCVVFGGGSDGLMGACARGAKAAGGRIIGIAPKIFDEPGILLQDCDELILTDSLSARKEKMFSMSNSFLALPGGIGTMDEFFEIITLRKLHQHDKEIIVFNINHFYDTMLKMIDEMGEKGFLYKQEELFKVATTIDEIFNYLK